jgi:hypothetical protein
MNCGLVLDRNIMALQFFNLYRQEFVKAVDAWRNRGSVPAPLITDSGGAKATGVGNVPVKGSMGGASAAALAMAAKIATELEVEQQEFRKRMSEQREVLRASIKQNEEMSMNVQGDSMLSEEKSSVGGRDETSDKKSQQQNMQVSVQIDDEDDDEGDFNESKQVMRAPIAKKCSSGQSPSDADMRGKLLSGFVVTVFCRRHFTFRTVRTVHCSAKSAESVANSDGSRCL